MAKYVIGESKIIADKVFNICEDVTYSEFKDKDKSKKTRIVYLDDETVVEMFQIKKDKNMKIVKAFVIIDEDFTKIPEEDEEDDNDEVTISTFCSVVLYHFKKEKTYSIIVQLDSIDEQFIEYEFAGSGDDISIDSSISVVGDVEPCDEMKDLYQKIHSAVTPFLDDCEG